MKIRPWLNSFTHFGLQTEIPESPFKSVTAMMEQAMLAYTDKIAFHAMGQTLTYSQVDQLSRDFSAYLQSIGIKKGDRVAVMMPNVLAFPIAMLGIIRAGAVQVNVNPLYTPHELEHQLNDAQVKTIIIYNAATTTLAEILPKTSVDQIITANLSLSTLSTLPSAPIDPRIAQYTTLVDALELGKNLKHQPVELQQDDLLFLQYTGGTTGLSKGAMLTHGNLLANCAQYAGFMPASVGNGQEISLITAIPLYHIFALMVNFISYFSQGAENWLVANPRDMEGFVKILKEARPSIITGVNTLFAGLLMQPNIKEVDWSRLIMAVGGGASIIPSVSERWEAVTGRFILEGYGLSETSPIVSFNPYQVKQFTNTTGLPMPSTDIKLVKDDGQEADEGESGEICVKGPQVMQGYWLQTEATEQAFTADGYFKTGDIGLFNDEGFLKIIDRKKDMILVSGFNVYPNDVEAVASACEGVVECACIGIPDEKSGEAVKLFVVRKENAQLSEEKVRAFCSEQLASYKIPKIIHFIDALPKSTVGKILRRELRDVQ